jgi:hypothetical protein
VKRNREARRRRLQATAESGKDPDNSQQQPLTPTQKLHHNMALAIARQVDAEIRLALNEVMGTEDWKFEQLLPRCAKVEVDGNETFVLDGVALVTFGPPDFERTTEDGKPCLRVVRNIERHWEGLEEARE